MPSKCVATSRCSSRQSDLVYSDGCQWIEVNREQKRFNERTLAGEPLATRGMTGQFSRWRDRVQILSPIQKYVTRLSLIPKKMKTWYKSHIYCVKLTYLYISMAVRYYLGFIKGSKRTFFTAVRRVTFRHSLKYSNLKQASTRSRTRTYNFYLSAFPSTRIRNENLLVLSYSHFSNTLSSFLTFQNLDKNVEFKEKCTFFIPFFWLQEKF